MPKTDKKRPSPPPADGGSYRRNKDGSFTRLDKPQKPDPGKTARREAEAKAEKADSKGAAKDSKSSGSNVSQMPGKGEKE
jgi:hypothetical protein